MDKLIEGLALVEEVNALMKDLQQSLELFEGGDSKSALEKIDNVQEGLKEIRGFGITDQPEIDRNLSEALSDLEWISDNSDRIGGED